MSLGTRLQTKPEHAHESEHVLWLVEAIKSHRDEFGITRLLCLNLVMSSCVRVIDEGVSKQVANISMNSGSPSTYCFFTEGRMTLHIQWGILQIAQHSGPFTMEPLDVHKYNTPSLHDVIYEQPLRCTTSRQHCSFQSTLGF